MGAVQGALFSKQRSCNRYANDYELAVRCSKDLEHLLEREYGAPGGHGVGLHDKITAARVAGGPLPAPLQRELRFIAASRNALVHDPAQHRISNRPRFVAAYDGAVRDLAALKTAAARRDAPARDKCAVM